MNLFEEIEFVWGHFAALFGGRFQTLTRKQPKISSIHSSPTKYNPTWPLQFPLHPWHCGKAICPIPKGSETPSTKGFTVLTPHRHSFRGVQYTHCTPRMLLRRPLLSLPTFTLHPSPTSTLYGADDVIPGRSPILCSFRCRHSPFFLAPLLYSPSVWSTLDSKNIAFTLNRDDSIVANINSVCHRITPNMPFYIAYQSLDDQHGTQRLPPQQSPYLFCEP